MLLLPLNREAHERRVREKGVVAEADLENILDKTEVYAEYNRQHPGFFDMFINSGMLIGYHLFCSYVISLCFCINAWKMIYSKFAKMYNGVLILKTHLHQHPKYCSRDTWFFLL